MILSNDNELIKSNFSTHSVQNLSGGHFYFRNAPLSDRVNTHSYPIYWVYSSQPVTILTNLATIKVCGLRPPHQRPALAERRQAWERSAERLKPKIKKTPTIRNQP